MDIRWLTAFLDTPRTLGTEWVGFWAALTASTVSAPRGDRGQFATLLPPDGDAFVRVQQTDAASPGSHLDLHVDDIRVAAAEAISDGATPVADHGDVIVLRSPAGLVFCVVPHEGEQTRPAPLTWPDGTSSLLDQICLDVPAVGFDAELAWWGALTGWRSHVNPGTEFGRLDRPAGMPLRLLFQRLEDGAAGMHLDFASSDRTLEVARQVTLGAEPIARRRNWDVLRDPAGREYCVTDRDPVTGTIAD